MIVYLDSSALLRVLLNQPEPLKEFPNFTRIVASKLLKTECLRSLERLRLGQFISEEEHLVALKELYEVLDCVEWIQISDKVLDRAGGGFPVALGTLDAIHLSSAILWREYTELSCVFASHDKALKNAATAMGFSTLG